MEINENENEMKMNPVRKTLSSPVKEHQKDKPVTEENAVKPARKSSNQLSTTLFHPIRVLSPAFQFGSCEEQTNDTTGLFFIPKKQKTFENHLNVYCVAVVSLDDCESAT